MMYEQNIVRQLYKKLLTFYPRAFREQLGESMEQTFNDLCNEKRQTKKGIFGFVFWTFIETVTGIIQEHILLITQGDTVKNIMTNPNSAALFGLLFFAPFVLLNAIVGNRIEPFFSLIRPGIHTGPFEYPLLFIVLFLIPMGSFIAIRPVFQKGAERKRNFYLVNVLLAVLLLMVFVMLSIGLGSDIYRCDVLQIPNCD
jgi:hypothetical protein